MEYELIDAGARLWNEVEAFALSLITRWNLYQIAMIVALFGVAHIAGTVASRSFEDWVRSHDGWPKGGLRLSLITIRHLRGMIFVILVWVTLWIMRETTWPSRSYFLGITATIATAWMAVSFGAQLFRNRALRRVVAWSAWIYIGLLYLGFLNGASVFLDSIAVSFGDFRLSALTVVKAAVVTGLLFLGAKLSLSFLVSRISRSNDISPSMRVLATKTLQVMLFGGVFAIGLRAVGFDLTGLAVLSGAIGIGIGFGLQKVMSNLLSGIIILLDKSVKPGDVISLGDTFGWISELGARYVSVVTRDGREFLIPNEDMVTGQVVNWSHSDNYVRIELTFGTSYADDPHLVRRIAVEAATGVARVRADRPVICHIAGFGDNSIDYILRVWIFDAHEGLASVRGGIFLALWDAFRENGISIPFPQREVRVLRERKDKATD